MPEALRVSIRSVAALLAALCVALSSPFAAGQDGPSTSTPEPQTDGQQPTFRGGVTYVSVDVYPRRDGRIVEGLTIDDFEILEDGVPQAIDRFEFVRVEGQPVDGDRIDPTSQADGDRQATDPHSRVFVVYLDRNNTTLSGGSAARRPVVDFLNATIGARDLFGVMTVELPAAQLVFARRTETLEDELERHWTWGRADRLSILAVPESPYEERLLDCVNYIDARVLETLPVERGGPGGPFGGLERLLLARHREDRLLNSLENLMERLGALRDERKNVLFVSEGWVPRGPLDAFRSVTLSQGALPGIGVGPGGRLGTGAVHAPERDLTWCDAEIQRLALADFESRFRELLQRAVEANVAFYPVDVGGLRTDRNARGALETLRTLAEATDGFAIVNTNDLAGGVGRIRTDLSAFYLLGYASSNLAANGRFRKIDVRVKAPGVRVSARRGYFAMTEEMAAAAAAAPAPSPPTTVDTALGRLRSLRDDAELFVAASVRAEGIDVMVELAERVRRGRSGGVGLDVAATGPAGQQIAARLELAPEERGGVARVSAPGMAEGRWRVVVRDSESGFDQHVDVELAAPELVGEPLAWRGLPSPRAPLVPAASGRVSRRERLRVVWPVVASGLAPGDVAARLLDRSGSALGAPLPLTESDDDRGGRAMVLDLPLGSLPEGDYLVELTAGRDGVSERRLLPFRVTR